MVSLSPKPWMPEVAVSNRWTRVAFGDVVKLSGERSIDPEKDGFERYVGLDHLDPGDLKIRRWGEISDGTTFTSVFRPGHVLFGKRRAYQRKVAVASFGGVCSSDLYVLEAKDSRLLSELLPYICQSEGFFEHAIGTSAGSLSPRTNWDSLATYEFALPPLDEQRRISTALNAVRSTLETLHQVATQAALARESYASCMWSDSSRETPTHRLLEVCNKVQDGTHFSPRTTTGEYRYVTSKNIRDGYLDLRDTGSISKDEHEGIYKRADVRFGDVLLTKDGANAGNVAMNSVEEPFSLLSSVAFIRPNPRMLLSQYLFEYLRSLFGRAKVLSHVSGSAITRLTLIQIRNIEVPTPSLAEQTTACEHFVAFERGIALTRSRINSLSELRLTIAAEINRK